MNDVTIGMTRYMKDHPKLKYIFFGGKGGVGKTVMAGAAALWAARQGRKTLLASTNPVHSLSNLLGQDVFGKTAMVCEQENCYAFEIDTKDTIERSKQEIREKINWFLRFADLSTKADDFIESATMNPAFEESAMFENMTDIMFKDEYDFYVFDTAPTANARRLLGMSKVYSLWVDKMLKSREEAKSLKELLSFSKKKQEDPLLDYLLAFKERMAKAQVLLTDENLTAFFFATLPESLPIAVITRFINWFHDFGIPVGGVVVNGVIQKGQVSENAAEFVLNRVRMQEEHMETIRKIFGDRVRAVIPLFETEVKGTNMLSRLAGELFSA
ncbi:MAG: arsenic transporter [Deltaproteobacteria bacterium HGW-Deltaproteobacteria-21]|jgi:arsenite-transporting ATPase|nr:TRC40/GET3/ArsA family transport-energizing ATPase [Desulfobacterales bacterium]PKN29063.1 MAG: arsenic transporter [Deltaproteobacteria bacterium HGW-Deltaproteobacteria-21]PKN66542.1 MAG: arsenic transporter [Deltaproteobacteria bacterium HGW-Deltaproteobacteria-15]